MSTSSFSAVSRNAGDAARARGMALASCSEMEETLKRRMLAPGRARHEPDHEDAADGHADREHRGVGAEETNPGEREDRDRPADHEAYPGGEGRADPGDLLRASGLARAEMRADEHHQRLPDGEDQRDLQELQAHADAVARERC